LTTGSCQFPQTGFKTAAQKLTLLHTGPVNRGESESKTRKAGIRKNTI